VADNALDFLAKDETLVVTYDITVQDDSGAGNDTSTTRQIVITITGTNDQPVITAVDAHRGVTDDVGTVPADPNTVPVETIGSFLTDNGSVTFADVDATDHEDASDALATTSSSVGVTISTALQTALADALKLPTTHFNSNTGTINWSFALDDSLVQYLAKD